jgi:hypothetical protein
MPQIDEFSFGTQAKNNVSEKFHLLKLTGKIYLNEFLAQDPERFFRLGYYFHVGTIPKNRNVESFNVIFGNYSATTFDQIIPYTRVNSIDALEAEGVYNCYFYDDETGEFVMRGTHILDQSSGQNPTTAYMTYNLYFTEGQNRIGNSEPLSLTGTDVEWVNRMINTPQFGFSQENALTGRLSASFTNVQLNNLDLYFNQFLTKHDSFSNQTIKLWRCIDDVKIIQSAFQGTIKGININQNAIDFQIQDELGKLDGTFYSKDNYNRSTYGGATGGGFTLFGPDKVRPIRRFYGLVSPFKTRYVQQTAQVRREYLDPTGMMDAVCVSYSQAYGTTTNRTWSCGFGPENFAGTTTLYQKTETIVDYLERFFLDYSDQLIQLSGGNPHNRRYQVGDTIRIQTTTGSAPGPVYALLMDASEFYIYVLPKSSAAQLYAVGNVVTMLTVSAVIVLKNNVSYYARCIRDYTEQIGPYGDVQIVFNNNFEANHAGMGAIDPESSKIYFRMWNNSSGIYDWTSILNKVLTQTGFPTNISLVGLASVPKLAFCVPAVNTDQFPTFREIVETICASVFGFIYFDKDGKLNAKLYDVPDGGANDYWNFDSDEANKTNIKKGDVSISIDYNDIVTDLVFLFSNRPYTYTTTNIVARRLHNTVKTEQINSFLDTLDTYFDSAIPLIQKVARVFGSRRALYSFGMNSQGFTLLVGSDMKIKRPLLGLNESTDVTVLSYNRTHESDDLIAVDFSTFENDIFYQGTV